MIVLYVLLALLALFLAVIIIRALIFKPKAQPPVSQETVTFDKDAAVDALAQLVRCKTISYNNKAMEDDGEFQKLLDLLPTLYPHVYKTCTLLTLPDRGLLYHWKGKQPGDPAVLMAHYDVVPVDED